MAAPQPIRSMNHDRLKVFTGNCHPALTREICENLDKPVADSEIRHFSDGEIHLQILENVRGEDVFVVQPTSTPVDRNLMELLLILDALKRACDGAALLNPFTVSDCPGAIATGCVAMP